VRNLSFSASTNQVKDLFSKYGDVKNVTLATKSDGKSRGFAFVQFVTKNNAEKAMKELNATHFLERPIAIDWALSKNKYLEVVTNTNASKMKDEKVAELKGNKKKGIESKTNVEDDKKKDINEEDNKVDSDNESDEGDTESYNDSNIKKYRRN